MTTSEIDTAEPAEVFPAGDGPCSREEAEDLIHRAASAAVQFDDAMREILRRQAWVPLGYSNPQDLIIGEFQKDGSLVNPRTGKPYGRAHIYRMARTALFLHEVSSRAGVDAGELEIAEKALRAARSNGVDDVTLLAEIEKGVIEVSEGGQVSAEAVQSVVDSVIEGAAGRAPATPPIIDDPELSTAQVQVDPPAGEAAAPPTSPTPAGEQLGPVIDDADWPNKDPHRESGEVADSSDPFGALGNQAPGSKAPVTDGPGWDAAVASARDFVDFSEKLRTMQKLAELLPAVSEVESKLPEFLDACDDSELNSFSEALDDVDLGLQLIPRAREAIRAIQQAAQDRAEAS